MTAENADPGLAARFPGWDIKQGADGSIRAWLIGTDPPLIISAKDEAMLREQIRAAALGTQP